MELLSQYIDYADLWKIHNVICDHKDTGVTAKYPMVHYELPAEPPSPA